MRYFECEILYVEVSEDLTGMWAVVYCCAMRPEKRRLRSQSALESDLAT